MNSKAVDIKSLWKPGLIFLAVVFLYLTVLVRLGQHWWTDENYSHGLLVPFVIAFIIWLRLPILRKLELSPSLWVGGVMVVSALSLLLAGTLGAELFVQRISFLLMLAGLLVYLFGTTLLRSLAIPFFLLFLAIPVPQIIFNKIAFPLQIYASQIAVWGIRVFGVPTVRKGNVIEILPEGSVQVIALEVVEACSGIRSLMTLMTLALILVFFTRTRNFVLPSKWTAFISNRDVIRGVILMLSAIPIAVVTNAARVTSTGVLTYYWGIKATESFVHEASGWFVYVIALVLLLILNLILRKALGVAREVSGGQDEIAGGTSAGPGRAAFLLLLSVLVFGGVFLNWFESRGELALDRRPLAEFSSELGDWKQKGDSIEFSEETEVS